MSDSHGRACARESTTRAFRSWLAGYDPGDGRGPVGPKISDTDLFGPDVVEAAFAAGEDQARAEFAIERGIGQRQLDDAAALIMEAAALFHGYADHHQARAEEAKARGDTDAECASLQKSRVNLVMTVRLKQWLAGEDTYTVPGEDTAVAHGEPIPMIGGTVERGEDGQSRVVDRWSNIRPASGPLAEPEVVDSIMKAVAVPGATVSAMAAEGLFKLQTGDPRFDPTKPLTVNGFRYHPATEA